MDLRERGTAFVAVLREMAADPGIVDELVAAAREQSPVLARLPVAENRRHIAVLLAAGLDSFGRPGDPSERDFTEAARLGADRAAQGVPITGLLSGVQAGRTRALEIAIDRGRTAGIADDVLVQVLLDLDRYTGALERHVIGGYHAAERELARSNDQARTRLLRRLLLGDGPADPSAELARLGLVDRRYHCLVAADVGDPARLRAAERALTVAGGVLGTVDGLLTGLVPRLPAAPPDLLVVSSPALPPGQLRSAYRLCLLALRAAAGSSRTGLHSVVDLAGEAAFAAQPLLAALLREALLGALDPADDFHRELACTALAYLDNGQRLDHTAAALHVHPNTVRYRLRRLGEITGSATSVERLTVLESARWWWALHSWLG